VSILDDDLDAHSTDDARGLRLTLGLGSVPWRRLWLRLGLPLVILLAGLALALSGTGYEYAPLEPDEDGVPMADAASARGTLDQIRTENERLRTRLARAAPRGAYVVIDRANNRLYLMRDGRVQLDARCSAGSGVTLKDGERTWRFETPAGSFKVLSKTKDPVWRKPDWAFREEGKPVPSDPGERIEYGTLGDYALHFGNGYMIHGTLYELLLGRSVTHGCIRLGREDLARVFENAAVGTPIYIF
jgi:L,D-transpeptidase YbiS